MIDFLTQLVNRTLGLTPLVQPSIASMYVPETVQGSSFVIDSDEQITSDNQLPEIPPFPRTIKADTEKFFNQETIAALPISPQISGKEIGREGVSGDLVAQITDADLPLPPLTRMVDRANLTDKSLTSFTDKPPAVPHPLPPTSINEWGEGSATTETTLFSSQEEDSQKIFGARTLVNEENPKHSSPSPLHVKGKVQNPESLDARQAPNSDTDDYPPLPPLTRMVDRANLTDKSLTSFTDKPPAVPHPLPPTSINEWGEGSTTTETTNDRAAILVDRYQSRQERSDRSNVPSNLASEPTIRVSIGRIEVRAIQPPAIQPAQPISPPAPKLSLDDYLRLRNGGQR